MKDNLIIFFATKKGLNSKTSGHGFDAEAIWRAFQNTTGATLLHYTDFDDHVVCRNRLSEHYIELQRKNKIVDLFCLHKILKKVKPIYVISFDSGDFDWGLQLLCFLLRKPLVHVKPGGPSSPHWADKKNLVVYSSADNFYYQTKTRCIMIPNRISNTIPEAKQYLLRFIREWKKSSTTFFRISRISEIYKPSFFKSIHLINKLRNAHVDARLVIVGEIICQNTYALICNEIKKLKLCEFVLVLTDKSFYFDAKKLLYEADIVVGIGRGAVEGALLKKPVLVFIKEYDLPVPLSEENVSYCISANFSLRTEIGDAVQRNALKEVINICKSRQARDYAGRYAASVFEKHFDVARAPRAYDAFAMSSEPPFLKEVVLALWIYARRISRKHASRIYRLATAASMGKGRR